MLFSGRRKAQVAEDRPAARPARLHLRGRLGARARRRGGVAHRRPRAARRRDDPRPDRRPPAPRSCCSSTTPGGSSTTRRGTWTARSRTSSAARSTPSRPTRCSPSTATATCGWSTTARSSRAHARRRARARLPPDPARGLQGARGRPPHAGARLRAGGDASRSATRARTSAPPPAVGTFWLVANALEKDPTMAEALADRGERARRRGALRRRRLRGRDHRAGRAPLSAAQPGRRPNQARLSAPPATSSSSAPPANTAVTSSCSGLEDSRVPRLA